MKTHYVKDIRVLSAFQQTIRAMQILILVLRVLAVAFLVLLGCCIHFFAQDFFDKTLKLAISGNVNALAEYLRSFGPWAIVISFLLDVFINAASIFPSICLRKRP